MLASTVRLLLVVAGRRVAGAAQATAQALFTLVAVAMAAYGLSTVLTVKMTSRGRR